MAENNKEDQITGNAEATQDTTIDQSNLEGKIHIAEDVIAQLAIKALNSIEGVSPANPGLMANLRIGRKTVNGVRISLSEDSDTPEIIVDTYISVKYGLRLPDVCWDVQEAVKEQIEKFTGYTIKGVNVYVHNITFADNKQPEEKAEQEDQPFSSFGEDA